MRGAIRNARAAPPRSAQCRGTEAFPKKVRAWRLRVLAVHSSGLRSRMEIASAMTSMSRGASQRAEPNARLDALAHTVIGAAIEVHRILGPGYLESVYEEALCVELALRSIK